jgi:hypothetical protein
MTAGWTAMKPSTPLLLALVLVLLLLLLLLVLVLVLAVSLGCIVDQPNSR